MAEDKIIAQPNFMLFFSKIGKTTKNNNDGRTAQNIFIDKSIIFWIFLVSLYSQIRAKIDTNGKDAVIAAIAVKRFASSETPKIIRAEMIILKIYCIYIKLY